MRYLDPKNLVWATGFLHVDDSDSKLMPAYYRWDHREDAPVQVNLSPGEEDPAEDGENQEDLRQPYVWDHDDPDLHVREELPAEAIPYPRVYFIEGAGMVKIGRANDPVRRMGDLQLGSPVPLVLLAEMFCPDASKAERALHKKFATSRSHGEWFFFTDEIKRYISSHANVLESTLVVNGELVEWQL